MFEKINTDGFRTLLTTHIFELPKKVTMPSMMTVSLVLGALSGAVFAHISFGHANSLPSSSQKKNETSKNPSLWKQFKQKAVKLKVTAENASKSSVAFIKQYSKELSIATVAISGAALLLRCKAGNTMPPLSQLQKNANYGQALADAQTQAVIDLAEVFSSQLERTEPHELVDQLQLPRKAQRGAHWLQMKADAPEYFAKRKAQAAL